MQFYKSLKLTLEMNLKSIHNLIRLNIQGVVLSGLAIIASLSLFSCDSVFEDMTPCAPRPNTITKVMFAYDYNMLREDLFNEHAGTAHLYVFDKDSTFLFDRSISRNEMTGNTVDFTLLFDTTYLKQGEKYFMTAMAQGNHVGYEWSTVSTPGFQIPLEHQMIPHVSKISDYRIILDRDSDSYADLGIVNYKDYYGNNKELMDTLWSTKPKQIQSVDIPYIVYEPRIEEYPVDTVRVVMPMMRITNSITVNLVHESFDEKSDPNDFNVLINFPYGNGTIGFTGQTYPNRELYYRSLRKNIAPYQQKQNGAQYNQPSSTRANGDETHAIQATFGVSRLQTTDKSSLQVWNSDYSRLIVQIGGTGNEDEDSFSNWLANYFKSYYGNQEFLDREYDFTIDIHLKDGKLLYVQCGCAILGWGKRVFDVILGK